MIVDFSDITALYLNTQGTINKLWEFVVVLHLAVIGWLLTVNDDFIQRAKLVLSISYTFLIVGILYFFIEAYDELSLLQNDFKFLMSNESDFKMAPDGFLQSELVDVDLFKRKIRAIVVFAIAWIATMSLLHLFLCRTKPHDNAKNR